MKLRFARAAERDLRDIGDWIARDDPDAAARVTAELVAVARRIATMPRAFPTVSGAARPGLRKRSFRRYIIYYRISRTTVFVVRILRHSCDQSVIVRKS